MSSEQDRYTVMSHSTAPTTDPGQPAIYQIRLKGHLGSQWTDWFEGLTITLEEEGDTLLTGPVEVMAGRMGPFPVTQASLLQASILMLIPAVMVFLSLALKPKVGRWVNIILGVLYTAVNIGNLVGETWAFYILYGIVEMALTLLIVGYAWKWRNAEA